MNEDISALLPRRSRRMLAALGFFAVALCCAAVLIVNHFQVSLGRELLRDFALSQVRHFGDAPEGGGTHLLNDLSTNTRDHFVMERIVDGKGAVAAVEVAPAFDGVASVLERCRIGKNGAVSEACQEDTPDGARYFFVREPLGVGGWAFEGIFRASPKTVHAADSIYLTVAVAVVATLVASLLLMYPTLQLLQSSLLGSNRRLLQANLDMLKALGCAIAKRDSDTEDHNFRVTLYAIRIAEKMGLEAPRIRSLIKGALLHDVGKIAVRDDILLKPGPLDAAETAEMRRHVHYGLEIIASS
ncbi:MAG: HD-GYP domain-containing protein, partial [Rhodospirillaceae bacterium]